MEANGAKPDAVQQLQGVDQGPNPSTDALDEVLIPNNVAKKMSDPPSKN